MHYSPKFTSTRDVDKTWPLEWTSFLGGEREHDVELAAKCKFCEMLKSKVHKDLSSMSFTFE